MGSYSYKKHKKSKHSKRSKRSARRKTRKMGGGSSGMGVVVESGSPYRYMNQPSNSQIAGCHSDNTTGGGAYSLNTPLVVGGQSGGGQVCTQSPYQFLQKGGGKKHMINMRKQKNMKYMKHKKGSRHMRGGAGSFWNFSKFWNPSYPENGGNVLSLSSKGISPAGLGAPISTAGDKPIPPIQPWPAQKLIMPHDYTKGGAQVGGGGRHTRRGKGRGRGRGLKGGSILEDIQNIGRSIMYGAGSAINGLSGYSNKIYNSNPMPTHQFPRGLGNTSSGGNSYNELGPKDNPSSGLKGIYDSAYAKSASM